METAVYSPLISVIIPTHNRATTVAETLESVLSQPYEGLEVIVVDDASSDCTVDIVREVMSRDNRVKLFLNEKNSGGNRTRNKGLDHASGDYMVFLDSDDIFLPRWSEEVVAALRSRPGSQTVLHYQSFNIWGERLDDTAAPIPERGITAGESAAEYLFLRGGSSRIMTLVVPMVLARAVRMDEELPKLQDNDWFLRVCASAEGYQFIAQPLAAYRLYDSDKRVSQSRVDVGKLERWRVRLGGLLSPRADAALCATIAVQHLKQGARRPALPFLARALWHNVMSRRRLVWVAGRLLFTEEQLEQAQLRALGRALMSRMRG